MLIQPSGMNHTPPKEGVYFTIFPMPVDITTKTCLHNFDPLKPHFYIVKLGFTGVHFSFLSFAKNIDCGYSLEQPRQGGSNGYPQSIFWAEIRAISDCFYLNFFHISVVKYSVYLNRHVFEMIATDGKRNSSSIEYRQKGNRIEPVLRKDVHYQELSYYRNCHSGYRYSNLDRFRLIPFDWRPVSVVLPV